MSADNWDDCPRCVAIAEGELITMGQNLLEQYGRVSFEEYEDLRKQYNHAKSDFNGNKDIKYNTFREDYEFYGASTGVLQISYSGQCTKCGLKLQFRDERVFYEGEK